MSSAITRLVGTDVDQYLAQHCRLSVLDSTITALSERLSELADELGATEERLGEAHQDATTTARSLQENEATIAAAHARLNSTHKQITAKAGNLWNSFLRLLHKLVASKSPLEIDNQLAVSAKALAANKKRLTKTSAELATANATLARLSAPFDDIEFARQRLKLDRQEASAERSALRESLCQTALRAIRNRPLWALKKLADDCPELPLDSLLAWRRQTITASLEIIRPSPPPLPAPRELLSSAIQAGFYKDSRRGRGSVSVSGQGTTRVRRSRWVTDSQGRRRRKSYWKTVSVRLSGSVDASFSLDTKRWRPNEAGGALAKIITTDLSCPPPRPPLPNDFDAFLEAFGLSEAQPPAGS